MLVRLCHGDDIPEGASRGFDPEQLGTDTVLVVRKGGQLYAYKDACPHHNSPMAWRKDRYLNAAGDRIVCAAHGALFEIPTGRCTLGPCLGDALTPMPLQQQANGDLLIATFTHSETKT